MLLAEIDQCVVGYNHVLWRWTEVTGMRVYLHLGYLLPAWRGKGTGARPTTFATNVSSTEREADVLVRADGYVAVHILCDMVLAPLHPFLELPLPVDVERRSIAPDHYRTTYGAWKDAFAGLWTGTPESDADFHEFVADNFDRTTFDPALCHIAWASDQVVGFVLTRIEADQRAVGPAPQ